MNEEQLIKKTNEFIDTLNDIIYDESDWYDAEELESAREQLPVLEAWIKLYEKQKQEIKKLKNETEMLRGFFKNTIE